VATDLIYFHHDEFVAHPDERELVELRRQEIDPTPFGGCIGWVGLGKEGLSTKKSGYPYEGSY
jgi:hypothetical protein